MNPARTILILSIVLGVALSLALVMLAAFSVTVAGPQLQATFFPIVKTTHIADSPRRTDTGMCWGTHFVKLHEGSPAYFIYVVTHKTLVSQNEKTQEIDEVIPVLAYKYDAEGHKRYLSKKGSIDVIHAPGTSFDDEYCFDAPGDLSPYEPFTVSGELEYDVPHGWWRVPATLPTFTVTSLANLKR